MNIQAAQRIVLSLALVLGVCLFNTGDALAQTAQPLPVTKGVYRLPYANGTVVRFSNDHTNHPTTLNRIDMTGQGSGPFRVVSAAAGWIRDIVEGNDTFCPNANNDTNGDGTVTALENQQAQLSVCSGYSGPSTFCCERDFEDNGGTCPGVGTCRSPNNFVWIEHPNGEWTKYTHMLQGSVGQGTDNNGNPGAGRFVGEFINAGTDLGIEGDVGFASGPHVHFEVAVPNYVEIAPPNATETDPDRPSDTINNWFNNGFLVGDRIVDDVDGANNPNADDVNRQNRIPVFCQLGFAQAGDTNTAVSCDDNCTSNTSQLNGSIDVGDSPFYRQVTSTMTNSGNDFVVRANAGASVRAGNSITLSPGFHGEGDSFFSASIGACDTPGGS